MHVTIHMNDNFFPQACARVCQSVRLSVCLSVTSWYYYFKTSGGGSKTSAGTEGRGLDDARYRTHERQLLSAGMRSCLSVHLSVCPSVTSWYYYFKTSAGTDGQGPDDTVDARHHTHDCLLLLLSISVLVLFSFPLFSCRFRAVD